MIHRALIRSLITGACAVLFTAQLAATESPRARLSLDANWKFHLGDFPRESFPGGQGVALYGADITHSDGKAGHAWGAAARGFDDRNWRTMNLAQPCAPPPSVP